MTRVHIAHGTSSVTVEADAPLAELVAAAANAWHATVPTDGPALADPAPPGFVLQQQPAQTELAEDR